MNLKLVISSAVLGFTLFIVGMSCYTIVYHIADTFRNGECRERVTNEFF